MHPLTSEGSYTAANNYEKAMGCNIDWNRNDVANTSEGSTTIPGTVSYNYLYHTYFDYWPVQIVNGESKVDKAFKVLRALQDAKVINVRSVRKFIDLVDVVAREL